MRFALLMCVFATACAGGAPPRDVVWAHRTWRPWILAGDSEMYGLTVVDDLVVFCGGYGWDRRSAVTALDAKDGRVRWEIPIGWCDPNVMVVDGVVIGRGSEGADAFVKAIDLRTGTLRWERSLARAQSFTHVAPLRALYLRDGETITRVDPQTGTTGTTIVPECQGESGHRRWLVAYLDRALFGCRDTVFTLDAQDRLIDLFKLPDVDRATYVATSSETLYLADGHGSTDDPPGNFAAFSVSDGSLLWNRKWRGAVGPPLVTADTIYVNVVAPEWTLVALDARTPDP